MRCKDIRTEEEYALGCLAGVLLVQGGRALDERDEMEGKRASGRLSWVCGAKQVRNDLLVVEQLVVACDIGPEQLLVVFAIVLGHHQVGSPQVFLQLAFGLHAGLGRRRR